MRPWTLFPHPASAGKIAQAVEALPDTTVVKEDARRVVGVNTPAAHFPINGTVLSPDGPEWRTTIINRSTHLDHDSEPEAIQFKLHVTVHTSCPSAGASGEEVRGAPD